MPAPAADLLFQDVFVLSPGEPVRRANIAVKDGRILPPGDYSAQEIFSGKRLALMPGMANMHDHLRDVYPGLAIGQGLKIDDWLRVWWSMLETQGPEEFYLCTLLGCLRLLKAGVTTVVDHAYTFHRPGMEEAVLRAYGESGIRWACARGIMTIPYEPICEPKEAALAAIRRLASERVLIAPVSLRQVTPDVYRDCRALAGELGLRLYTHIAETPAEGEDCVRQHGKRPVEFLHANGFTGPDVTLVHCTQLSEAEKDLLASTGTHVVHCPTNHMKLAKGVTDVPGLLARGVNVCLGVDQMTDVLADMRSEVLLQSVSRNDPAAIGPEVVLEMATLNGARALGWDAELGSLTPGKRADLALLDLSGLHHSPFVDPLFEVVFRARAGDVCAVVVDGRVVVRDGKLAQFDEDGLVDQAQDMMLSYLKRAGKFDLLPKGVAR